MTTCDRSRGFTLLELIVVLAVLALIAGTAVPLAGAVVVAEKRDKATQDLEQLAAALDAYYFDNAAFPASLTASDFFGVYFQHGRCSSQGPRVTCTPDSVFVSEEQRVPEQAGMQMTHDW